MKVVIQRVKNARVEVLGKVSGSINKGLLLLIGVGEESTEQDISKLVNKISNLRIFEDENGKLNDSILDIGGKILAVSQFTLYANCKKGRRPDFTRASNPDKAISYYERMITEFEKLGLEVEKGIFGAHMHVDLLNDGPVTIIMDAKEL